MVTVIDSGVRVTEEIVEVQEEDQAADRVKVKFHQTPIVTIAEKQVTSPGIAQRRKKTERRRESKEKRGKDFSKIC